MNVLNLGADLLGRGADLLGSKKLQQHFLGLSPRVEDHAMMAAQFVPIFICLFGRLLQGLQAD